MRYNEYERKQRTTRKGYAHSTFQCTKRFHKRSSIISSNSHSLVEGLEDLSESFQVTRGKKLVRCGLYLGNEYIRFRQSEMTHGCWWGGHWRLRWWIRWNLLKRQKVRPRLEQLKWQRQTTEEVVAMKFVETCSIKLLTIGGITVDVVVDFHS